MTHSLNPRISPADLDRLMRTLEVEVVALSECAVSPGHRLELGGVNAPGIHYNLSGTGWLVINRLAPIPLKPHTLIIVPSNCPFRIEVAPTDHPDAALKRVDGELQTAANDGVRKFVAGSAEPSLLLICGYFQATYGNAAHLFHQLEAPIVEQFNEDARLDEKLKSALSELVNQEIGSGAMTAVLLKQVIIALLRRSLSSLGIWVERFSMLSDPRIAKAFSEMAARPGAPHTVESLAELASLSRSAFMARFSERVGQPPMLILRELRMREAAQLLRTTSHSVERIAREVGYASRSSFVRAFRNAHDRDPSEYRNQTGVHA